MDRLCLDSRLSAVARWVLPGQSMADIGTDHAMLPCWLVLNGRCPQAIAADVAREPYLRAARTAAAYGLADRVSVRLGSGFSVLAPGEAATVVLAGMGGRLICRLLQEDGERTAAVSRLILQPQRHPELVRAWLAANGWRIVGDDLAQDGKMWYNIIAAERGAMELNEDELLYGRVTSGVSPELRRRWLSFRRETLLKIANQLQDRPDRAAARLLEVEREAARLQRLISEVRGC